MRIGSDEHLALLCRTFIDTHRTFDPERLTWPALDETQLATLRALPFWDEAVTTETRTGARIAAWAVHETPPLLREAVTLQGYEEQRHARLLYALTRQYGITARNTDPRLLEPNLEQACLRTGYGECIDSFFAFGLFALARDARFLPDALLDLMEPIVQEEARHILFHVNWVAYKRAQHARPLRPWHRLRCVAAFVGAAWDRVQQAMRVAGGEREADEVGFTASSATTVMPDVSPSAFVQRCLEENERRLAPFDARLLRPRLVPGAARAYLRLAGPAREPRSIAPATP